MPGTACQPTDKPALRRALRARRLALSAPERIQAALDMVENLAGLPGFARIETIAGYWAVGGELPLLGLFGRGLWARYHLPCLHHDGILRFAAWKPGDAVRSNAFGIPEPDVAGESQIHAAALDVVLLPLLGFTRTGHRLGQGGGWYDRSLAFLNQVARPARPLLVGVGYALQEIAEFDTDSWDVRLDYVATERELLPCAAHEPEPTLAS
jgi:5-formyltetrahydrofolate cyclo-ligase